MIFRPLRIDFLIGTTVLAAALCANSARAEDYVKSYPIATRANVHVDTNDGSVTVVTADTQQVEIHVEYTGFELQKTLHIDSGQQGDRVEVTARIANQFGFSLGRMRKLHIEVRMPKQGDLQVETGDGSVQASALSGNISLHTHDGSIKVERLGGNIDLHSGDGSITVMSLNGAVSMHTGDGSIEGSELEGKYDAQSGDGRIRLSGRFDALKIKTGDGSIDTRALSGSKVDSGWSIVTGSGSVVVALPGNLQFDIDATTGDGQISFDMPVSVQGTLSKSRVRGKVNGGGETLSIRTGDGSIYLKQS